MLSSIVQRLEAISSPQAPWQPGTWYEGYSLPYIAVLTMVKVTEHGAPGQPRCRRAVASVGTESWAANKTRWGPCQSGIVSYERRETAYFALGPRRLAPPKMHDKTLGAKHRQCPQATSQRVLRRSLTMPRGRGATETDGLRGLSSRCESSVSSGNCIFYVIDDDGCVHHGEFQNPVHPMSMSGVERSARARGVLESALRSIGIVGRPMPQVEGLAGERVDRRLITH